MKEVRKIYDDNGVLEEEAEYENHRFHGYVKRYYSSGQLKECMQYLNGVADGPCIWYYENGHVKREMNYRMGQLSGDMFAYTESGTLKESWTFENGEIVGCGSLYSTTGEIKKEVRFKKGELERISDFSGQPNSPKITLFSKDGCHLCDRVLQAIQSVRKKINFDFEIIDIAHDSAMFQKYQNEIPVVTLNGEEIARSEFSEERLLAYVRSKSAKQS